MDRRMFAASLLSFLLLPAAFGVEVKMKQATELRDRSDPRRIVMPVPAGSTFDAERVEGEWLVGALKHAAGVSRGMVRKEFVLDPEKLAKLEQEYQQRMKLREEMEMWAKGFVKYDGEWVTPEEKTKREEARFEQDQMSKGLVKFEGQWVNQDQRAAIINDRFFREVELLIGVLRDSKSTPEQKDDAEKRLVRIGSPAVKPLLAELQGPNRAVRGVAAAILGKIGGKEAIQPLVAALEDEDACAGAAAGLGQLGDRQAVPELIKALQDEDAVRGAAEALGRIGDVRAVEPLIKVMRDLYEDDATRAAAAKALGMIGDARALSPLKEVMEKDKNPLVREAAREAYDRIRPSS